MQENGDREELVNFQWVSGNLDTVRAHGVLMTALRPTKSTYLLASKEAPTHVSNQPSVRIPSLSLTMIVPVRQVVIATRHPD